MHSTVEQNQESGPPKAGAFACYRYGWRILKRYFLELVVIVILAGLAALPGGFFTDTNPADESNYFTLGYLVLLFLPLQYGVDFAFLRAAKREHPQIGDILEFFSNYVNVVLSLLLVHAFVGVGLVLAVVPGIIFMCKLAFVPYLVTYERIGALDSIRLSWRMTQGHAWTIFRIWLISLPLYLLGIATLGVGVIISIMWVSLAHAALFYRVSEHSEALQSFRSRLKTENSSHSSNRNQGSSRHDKGLPNLLDRE